MSLNGSVVELRLLARSGGFMTSFAKPMFHCQLQCQFISYYQCMHLRTFHGPTMVPSFPPEYNPCMYGHPYQSPTAFSFQTANPNPFYLKFISGNIRTCQGCRGSLRCAGSSIPEPPHNICIARAEKRPY